MDAGTDRGHHMFDAGKSPARPQYAAHFGDDLFRLFDRAEHERAEYEVYGCRREIEFLSGEFTQIQVDPALRCASSEHRVHMPIGLDGDEPRTAWQVTKIGA